MRLMFESDYGHTVLKLKADGGVLGLLELCYGCDGRRIEEDIDRTNRCGEFSWYNYCSESSGLCNQAMRATDLKIAYFRDLLETTTTEIRYDH